MPKRGEFLHNRFILTEGADDAALTRAVIAARNLAPFDVSPVIDCGSVQGNSGFENAVIACEAVTGFTRVNRVVLIADNDDTPADSVTSVCTQLRNARQVKAIRRNWGVPNQAVTPAPGDPSVAVWMWPSAGQPGCLETLLWQVIQALHPNEAACVDTACACTGANTWPISKLDKARVKCFIALTVRRKPALGLGQLWAEEPGLIPATHAAFDTFANFLTLI
jgi:hypothetical protein